MLQCPICKEKLNITKSDNSSCETYACINKHSFDISKRGYVNLLVNKSNSGDNKEMVIARHNFLQNDYYLPLALKIKDLIKGNNIKTILDAGCGEGYYDRIIIDDEIDCIYGIDISKDAIDLASRNKNDKLKYFVAGVNNIPFINDSFDAIMSIFAPIDNNEFKRISKKYIIKVIPNVDHLLELKENLYKEVYKNKILDDNIEGFDLIKEDYIKYMCHVTNVNELFKMTPYYYTTHNNYSFDLKEQDISFDFIIRLYEKKSI